MTEWHERRDLPWAKVHVRWIESPSHRDLSGTTLWVGLAMMLLANQGGRQPDGSGWCINRSGRALSAKAIANFARVSPRDVEVAIDELVEAGTIVLRGDGAVGFLGLRKWQEDPSAARVRRHRENVRAGVIPLKNYAGGAE